MIERWRLEGLVLLPPEPASAVRESFGKIGVIPTPDVISMYSVLGGMQEMDREYWRLWSLAEVGSENTAGACTGVLFSDYLIGCWSYRLLPTENDTSAVVADYFDSRKCVRVANSLQEFFDTYAENPYDVLERTVPSCGDQ